MIPEKGRKTVVVEVGCKTLTQSIRNDIWLVKYLCHLSTKVLCPNKYRMKTELKLANPGLPAECPLKWHWLSNMEHLMDHV